MNDAELLEVALEQARIGRAEGGVPIGAAILIDGAGRRRRAQPARPARERDSARRDGRPRGRRPAAGVELPPRDDGDDALAVRHVHRRDPAVRDPAPRDRREPHVHGRRGLLRSRGVEVVNLDSAECYDLLQGFIAEHPEIWNEDIGEE